MSYSMFYDSLDSLSCHLSLQAWDRNLPLHRLQRYTLLQAWDRNPPLYILYVCMMCANMFSDFSNVFLFVYVTFIWCVDIPIYCVPFTGITLDTILVNVLLSEYVIIAFSLLEWWEHTVSIVTASSPLLITCVRDNNITTLTSLSSI